MPAALVSGRADTPWLRRIILSSLLCLAGCTRHVVPLHNVKDKPCEFDYFLLVRQWPGSYCSTHDCPRLQDFGFHFTIHGLWPNYNDGTWPQFCAPEDKFDEDQLEDLLEDLEAEWPSTFFSSENADFWEHEWSKHGTCALDIFPTEHSYFDRVLKLHGQYDLTAALRKGNILPSTSTVYRAEDLIDVIEDTYGVRPLVHCDEEGQLSEIWLCFDKQLKPFSCNTSYEASSCQEVVIPPSRGGAGQGAGEEAVAATTTAAVVATAAGGSVALSGKTESDGAAAVVMAEAMDGVEGSSGDGRTALKGGAAEDSIYSWLLEHDTRTGPFGVAPWGDAATATAAAEVASVGEAATAWSPLGDADGGSETSSALKPDSVKVSAGADDPNFGINLSYLYGDAFPVVHPQNPTHVTDEEEEKQHLLEIRALEQRLLEREERMAAEAAAASRRVGGGGAASNAVAALKAMAEHAIAQLQQQVHSFGGEHINADLSLNNSYDTTMPVPTGGAGAAARGGAQDFVWTSKLRQISGEVAGFSDGEAESAAAHIYGSGGGGRGTAALAVVTGDDGRGPALWTVQGILVLPVGADAAGRGGGTVAAAAAAAGVNVGVTPASAPPMWVALLLAMQLTCVVVITLGLVVVVGMTLAGYRLGARDSRTAAGEHLDWDEAQDTEAGTADLVCCNWHQQKSQQQHPQQQMPLGYRRRATEENNLVEPLLSYDEYDCDGSTVAPPPKVEQADRECSRPWSDTWQGTVLVLPVAAASMVHSYKLDASQPLYAPVH